MNEWQSTFNEFKKKYVVQTRERLGKVEDLIGQLNEPTREDVIKSIRHHFHWLAGSGGIYGFPELTALGKEAESFCDTTNAAAVVEVRDRLQTFVGTAKEVFSAGAERVQSLPTVAREVSEQVSVLLVDSDSKRAVKLRELFEELSIAVTIKSDFSQASATLQDSAVDGLIVTVPLVDGSGYDLVEKFRSSASTVDSPALILNSTPGFLDKVQAIHSGADGFFEEPIVLQDVAERMRFLLETPDPPDYRILYVEDDPYQAEFVRAVLSSAGYAVEICDSAKNFDAALTNHQPDLVLLDIMLPDVSGYELARYLRQNEAYATLPILFLTTESKIDAKIRAAKAGGDDYLIKPVAPSLLLSTVAAKLERARFLKSLLHRDGLTKLLTHTAFMNLAQAALSRRARQPEKRLGLLMIDIDKFKQINDTHGHPVGDSVIISLANLLRRRVRRADLVGRYGGEEFVVIVEDLSESEVETLAKRLLADFSSIEHKASERKFHSTFSAGISMFNASKMQLGDWVNAADDALLQAKQAGRNRIIIASSR